MTFPKNCDPMLIAQFYATVHFSTGEQKSFTWMTRNEQCSATLADLGALLGYQVIHDTDPSFFRCHNYGRPMIKEELAPLYMEGDVVHGCIKYLLPTWDIMNRIFRDTIAPKVGNVDQIHGFQVDLLVNTYKNRGKGLQLDVMDFIWNEMTLVAALRRVPSFCPYIMALILEKSVVAKAILPSLRLVQHKSRGLIVKVHETPFGAPDPAQDEEMDPGLFGTNGAPMRSTRSRRGSRKGKEVAEPEAPGWAKRLQASVNKLFCLNNDINERQYEAYVREKKNRKQHKAFMRSQGFDVSHGSEARISPKKKWLSKHRLPYEDDASFARRQPTPDEEDEE